MYGLKHKWGNIIKQKRTHREQTRGFQREENGGMSEIGQEDLEVQTCSY